ncbi:MAG: NAD(P)H-dependent oxidoreductase subunit E [Chromatiales bacterium]|nr:NAD(P)H-dependent oxidoreductase subunit E [Chromatiales bacterium]
MSYYKYHVFFCTNLREEGETSCQNCNAKEMRDYAKARSKELGLVRSGEVRVNTAGCMNRCEDGPVIVIYPEAVWYTYVDKEDIDEIIEEHLLNGRVVERLKI